VVNDIVTYVGLSVLFSPSIGLGLFVLKIWRDRDLKKD